MKLRNSFKNILNMNIQERVVVILNDRGYSIYDKYYFRKYQKPAPDLEMYEFTLLELMQIFGPHLFEGGSEVFIDNKITHVSQLNNPS